MLVQRRASRRASLARLTLLVTLILSPNWSLPQPARADTLCVNIGGTGGCFGTITAALNAAADGDTILIAAGIYLENLTINKSLTITGAGATPAGTVIDGNGSTKRQRVLTIARGKTVALSRMLIRNGWTQDSPGGVDGGGGIYNSGTLMLNECTVGGNRTGSGYDSGHGGGIYNDGILTLNESTVSSNVTGSGYNGGDGGGIFNAFRGTLTVNSSMISDNVTGNGGTNDVPGGIGGPGGNGGGIYNDGTLTLNHSTISGNTTGSGGNGGYRGGWGGSGGGIFISGLSQSLDNGTISGNGTGSGGSGGTTNGMSGSGAGVFVYFGSPLTATASTISGNFTGLKMPGSAGGTGGGIHIVAGTVNLIHVSIAFNQVDSSPGIGGGIANISGTVNLKNTLLSNNHIVGNLHAVRDCAGPVTSQGYNLIQRPLDCAVIQTTGDLFNVTAMLGPLADNGGPTQIHAPLPGSPAIDAADNSTCGSADQRGYSRPYPLSGRCDIGAVEYGAPSPATTTPTPTNTPTETATPTATSTATSTPIQTSTPTATVLYHRYLPVLLRLTE